MRRELAENNFTLSPHHKRLENQKNFHWIMAVFLPSGGIDNVI